MLKIASPLLRFPAIFGVFFALFAGTILFSSTAHAANSQPTYTLTAGSLITAKGGFIDDPNASNPMFVQSGGKWVFEGAGDSRQAGYYNTTTREIYFKWSPTAQAYVTHTNYANSGGIVITGDACDVSIKIDPGVTTGGTFVGVSVKTGKQTSACTAAVKDKIQLSSDPVFNNVSQATGETFFGVTIPTCTQTPGTSSYITCFNQRNTALSNLANAIVCDTSSQQGIAECTYNKSILSCLQANPGNTVAHCKTKADAQAILNGDYSAINADTSDASIKAVCQTLSGKDNQTKCIAMATAERDRLKGDNGSGVNKTSCAVDGVGWIICPIMGFMAKLNDSAFSFLQSFLSVRPALVTNPGTQSAWAAFRDIANVAFVIAFLVIVYSQLTSAGVSNYGIKKMLPRIVIAAILVNVSFYVCEIAVDVSNIVGSSVYSLFKNINVGNAIQNASWEDQTAGILSGVGVGIGLILLVVLVVTSPMVLLAFVVIILILIARQAFVILLVVMSPLAFVAYLLPNTESWFKKWWKAFSATLMVYPIIGVVFGASTLASNILNQVAATDDHASLLQLIALGVLAVPLFAVPALLKGALSSAGSIGQTLAGLQDRANRRGIRGIKEGRLGEAKAAWDRNRQTNRFKRRTGQGRLATWGKDREGALGSAAAWLGTRQKAFDSSSIGSKLGGTRGAAVATQGIFKQFDEDVAAFKTTMSSMGNEALIKMITTKGLSSEQRAAAAGMIMSRDHRDSHLAALHAVGQAVQAAEQKNDTPELGTLSDIEKQMSHDMKDKPWALGDEAAGQLVNGVYGRSINNEGETQRQFGDITKEIKDRVGKKLSAASIAKMNPDEMTRIQKLALSGSLDDTQLSKLQESIKAARANPQMNDLIKAQEAQKHDEILTYIADHHPDLVTVDAPAPTNPTTPPSTTPSSPPSA